MLGENQINAQEMAHQLDLADSLRKAIWERNSLLVVDLLDQGANPNTICRQGYTALGALAVSGKELVPCAMYSNENYHQDQQNILKALTDRGADMNQHCPELRTTPLMTLASKCISTSDPQLKHSLYSLIIDYVQSGANPHVTITPAYIVN
jgi:hypothetical protein